MYRYKHLPHDLIRNDVTYNKCRERDDYCVDLYRALCNNTWVKKEEDGYFGIFHTSWRGAGAVCAEVRGSGDYLDWYCSNSEGQVSPEINKDLLDLGWSRSLVANGYIIGSNITFIDLISIIINLGYTKNSTLSDLATAIAQIIPDTQTFLDYSLAELIQPGLPRD